MTDFDGDGMLDLILSHGESMAQPISIFKGTQVSQAGFLVLYSSLLFLLAQSLLPCPLAGHQQQLAACHPPYPLWGLCPRGQSRAVHPAQRGPPAHH